jgi:hypothetical protein
MFQAEAQEAHEREPVADLVFDLLIGQVVKRLQHQHLEHHDGVERLAPGVALPRLGRQPDHRLDVGAEALEGDERAQRLQRITLGADRLQAPVEIVEPQLTHGRPPPIVGTTGI